MATEIKVTCVGASGKEYKYFGFPIGTQMPKIPGNYIFAKSTQVNSWTPIYIGETGDLQERFENHHKKDCIIKNGATHVFVHKSSSDQSVRLLEETDLRTRFNKTSCNDQ
jgi:predicted GIY-YIG superfamily endonuclease